MTDEETIKELTERGMRAALLLGEITGRLHVIINDVQEVVY